MATERLSNNAITSLALSANSSSTTITVASFSLFPNTGDFRIIIDNELMLVTGGSNTTTWTVQRGIEGTTGAAHAAGAQVSLVLTSAGLLKYVLENTRTTFGWLSYLAGHSGDNNYVTSFESIPAPSVLPFGLIVGIFPLQDNTGSATLNVSGTGAIPLTKNYNQPLDAGDIKFGQFTFFVYDSTQWQLISAPSGIIRGPRSTVVDRSIPIYSGTTSNLVTSQSNWSLASDGSLKMQNGVLNNNINYLYNTTTNATQTELFIDGASTRLPILATATAWNFSILLTAKTSGNNTQSAAWEIKGGIHRNNSTVSFMGTPTVTNLGDSVSGAWSVTVTADSVNNTLDVKVTGQAGQTIKWVARVETIELTY